MRATGLVERIGILGRIKIPEGIRRGLKIEEGDPLEVFIDKDDGKIIFRQY